MCSFDQGDRRSGESEGPKTTPQPPRTGKKRLGLVLDKFAGSLLRRIYLREKREDKLSRLISVNVEITEVLLPLPGTGSAATAWTGSRILLQIKRLKNMKYLTFHYINLEV